LEVLVKEIRSRLGALGQLDPPHLVLEDVGYIIALRTSRRRMALGQLTRRAALACDNPDVLFDTLGGAGLNRPRTPPASCKEKTLDRLCSI